MQCLTSELGSICHALKQLNPLSDVSPSLAFYISDKFSLHRAYFVITYSEKVCINNTNHTLNYIP